MQWKHAFGVSLWPSPLQWQQLSYRCSVCLTRLPWLYFSSYYQKVGVAFYYLQTFKTLLYELMLRATRRLWICVLSCDSAVMKNPGPWSMRGWCSVATCQWALQIFSGILKETGSGWREENSPDVERWLLPQRELNWCLSGENQSWRTFGCWALPKHTQWWLKRPSFLWVWREKKKNMKVCSFTSISFLLFPQK